MSTVTLSEHEHKATTSFTSRLASYLALARPAVLPFVVTRAFVLLTAFFLQWLLDTGRAVRFAYIGDAPLAALTSTFDANWYINIARFGYSTSPNVAFEQNYAFFPLYPLLIGTLTRFFGLPGLRGNYAVVGAVLSNISFFLALVLLYHLTLKVYEDKAMARRTIWVLAALPWAFAFSMTYAESLFLLLSLAAALAACNAMVSPRALPVLFAGLLAALTTFTRPQGIEVALLVVALVALVPRNINMATRLRNATLAGAPAALAFSSFIFYIGQSTGNYMAVPGSRVAWGHGWYTELPRVLILPPANQVWFVDFLETVGLLVWVGLTVALLVQAVIEHRRGGPSGEPAVAPSSQGAFAFYACLMLLTTLAANPSNGGWGRFLSVVFPCIWIASAATLKSKIVGKTHMLVTLFLALQALFFAATVLAQVTP